MTRPEKVARARARALRAQGLLLREIAAEMGVALSTAHAWLWDPDGSKLRARKDSYRGTCEDCGGPTDGSNGPDGTPTRCRPCHLAWERRRSRAWILDAIREWADEYGEPPSARQWNATEAAASGDTRFADGDGRWPATRTVQQQFGSWNAAIRAAGFAPRRPGRPRKVAA